MIEETSDGARAKAGASKSASAFRTISEVSGDLEVPQHVLRFWETKFPQIKPLKRGGGRRYYRPDDVELLRRIQALLYQDGYTIKGVQKLLRESRGLAGLPPPGTRMPSLFDEDEGGDDTSPEELALLAGDEETDEPPPEKKPPTRRRKQPLSPEVREVLSEILMDLTALRRLLD
ncbi:MerR family transcriptional regulator [Niveispirillum sp.]|uniref:MerR family transcriptional regulator n=1 Tax=Niveispirillum sp. TaxID=1917217 RepID=UPI001B5ED802|nr:MerR family transcriptional regulator [Niveispirillum sp.]MBP7340302.1 MerR family transcriptional regulator [Niveispirillum sp.]